MAGAYAKPLGVLMTYIANGKSCAGRFLLLIVVLSVTAAAQDGVTFNPQLAPFAVKVNGQLVTHAIGFRTVLPGEEVRVTLQGSTDAIALFNHNGPLAKGRGAVRWNAPKKPSYMPLRIVRERDKKTIVLQLFVMQPTGDVVNGHLNGYRIGSYPPPLRDLKAYTAPRGFIEVPEALESLKISPHFTLGQFLCKQKSGYPKYLVLRPALVTKLEFLLGEVNHRGIPAESFVVMSGYRTPYYNKAIGNVANSRHIYGGAADFYIDVSPQDGVMDDLNRDGRIDIKDALVLYDIADHYVDKTGKMELLGGVGLYKATAAHGPFVHVDVRGTRARW